MKQELNDLDVAIKKGDAKRAVELAFDAGMRLGVMGIFTNSPETMIGHQIRRGGYKGSNARFPKIAEIVTNLSITTDYLTYERCCPSPTAVRQIDPSTCPYMWIH